MLRELTDALEAMARRAPLVVCVDDLHWSDVATLDWIASFAQRSDPAAVAFVGTCRQGDAGPRSDALAAIAGGLRLKGRSLEIALDRLAPDAVADLVMARWTPADGARPAFERLAALVHQRTQGNPLFVINLVSELAARGLLSAAGDRWIVSQAFDAAALVIPGDLRRAIEQQVDRLDDEDRRLLEAASVAGGRCAAATVAAATRRTHEEVEAAFERLVRRGTLVKPAPAAAWPDGTVSACVEFTHPLYREVIEALVPPLRRAELHRAIAERLEHAYGPRAPELAADLAAHFEACRDWPRAADYAQHAAETARSRSAHEAARDGYRRALSLVARLAAGEARDEREVALQVGLGSVVMEARGWAAPEVEAAYARVRALAEARGGGRQLLPAVWNLWIFHTARGDLKEARRLADRLVSLAAETGEPAAVQQAHHAQWSTRFAIGDLAGTTIHARAGLRLCDGPSRDTLAYGSHDTAICARLFSARALALGGRTDAAAAVCDVSVTLAREIDHPFTLAFALMHAAAVHEIRRDVAAVRIHAAESTALAREYGLALMGGWASSLLGWSVALEGDAAAGMALVNEGLAAACGAGSDLFRPHFLGLLASVQAAAGRIHEARRSLGEAISISRRTGERFYLAELHRLAGETVVLRREPAWRPAAQRHFHRALRLAEEQGAAQFALRAAVSLTRTASAEERVEAVGHLRRVRALVTEGQATSPDVQDADALLARIPSRT
jgi:predicted ATPase